MLVIRGAGKAKDVFKAIAQLAKTRGAETLGSIIKEEGNGQSYNRSRVR